MTRFAIPAFAAMACIVALTSFSSAANAATLTVDTTTRPPFGSDSATAYAPGTSLRITASGAVVPNLPIALCATSLGPRGCPSDVAIDRPLPLAPFAALIGTFSDAQGRAIGPPFFIGEGALVVAPPVPSHLSFRVNAYLEGARGGFTVTTVAAAPYAAAPAGGASAPGIPRSARPADVRSARRALGTRGLGPVMRAAVQDDRAVAYAYATHLAYGLSSDALAAMRTSGTNAWLAAQLNPSAIDDSAFTATLQPRPATLDANGNIVDSDGFERRLVQRAFGSARQLQEKMVLHWIDHFAVGNAKVNDAAMMAHYEETLRADALGNFRQLLIDVAKEPSMLIWLDNDGNNGRNAGVLPNENFSRELMQLYVLGTAQLNGDGTPKLDGAGVPLPSFSQTDVTQVAAALTGFKVAVDRSKPDPNVRFSVSFAASAHATGAKTVLGTAIVDPGDVRCVDGTMDALVRYASTAPFEALELIQRLATPAPSAAYVARVSAVWSATVDAPDQIAQVVRAIATDPEFGAAPSVQLKEPAETLIQALRLGGGVLKSATSGAATIGPGQDLVGGGGMLFKQQQWLYDPPSVFSFYRPGHKDQLFSQQTLLTKINAFTTIFGRAATANTTVTIDTAPILARMAGYDHARAAAYLLDATAGGAPELFATIDTYLQNGIDDAHVRGALWLIFTSPEYEAQG